MDVSSDDSVNTAAKSLADVNLYAIVNNAGVGLGSKASVDQLIQTNLFGPKRVTDAFVSNLDPKQGRVVNVSSGVAAMWLRDKSDEMKKMFTNPDTTWDQLKTTVLKLAPTSSRGGYGISKAALNCLTLQQAKKWPSLKITSLTPGFIQTKMTKGFGAKLTPEQGTVSMRKCLFGNVTSGYYYGSDGLRSPLTVTRDPGMPEYQGEKNPDPKKYNR
jgi:carbonyl reductase 1